jgi:hypothetical protein
MAATPETKMIGAIVDACVEFLVGAGELNGKLRVTYDMHKAARRVVWTSHYYGQTGVNLRTAIGELEKLVGRPERESDI